MTNNTSKTPDRGNRAIFAGTQFGVPVYVYAVHLSGDLVPAVRQCKGGDIACRQGCLTLVFDTNVYKWNLPGYIRW